MNRKIKSKLITGISKYLRSGDHPLRPTQIRVLKDIVVDLKSGHEYGYIKRPTGTGKTVMFGAEIAAANMPTLILTPRTNLIRQIKDTLLNKSLFDFKPEQIGTYHTHVNSSERRSSLKAPILITTYASYNKLGIKNRPLVILDEVHRARGEVARELIKELLGKVYVQGWTATDTFVTGQNIGHYLFNGVKPLHVTSISEAVAGKEISYFKNVIVETHLGKPVKVSGSKDYTEKQLEKIVKRAGRDEAAIRFFSEVRDKETGLCLRDMKSIWYCAGVAHAERVAKKLSNIFGKGFALAVSGSTPKKDLDDILDMHRDGEIPCIVNADLLIEGFDSPSTGLAMMLRPTRSPIIAEQTGGRVLRIDPKNPSKIAYIIIFIDEGMYDVVPFGVVAGNTGVLPKRSALTEKTLPKVKKPNLEDLPEFSSMDVRMSHLSVLDFIKKREAYLRSQARELTEEQKKEIIEANRTYNANATKAARHLEYGAPLIRKVWKSEGLKSSRTIAPEEIEEIKAAYKKYNANAAQAAKHLEYGESFIRKVWKSEGLKSSRTIAPEEIEEIKAAYKPYEGNILEASKHLSYSRPTIRKYWIDEGLEPKSGFSPREIKEIIEAHKKYKGRLVETARRLHHSLDIIREYWSDAGLKPMGRMVAPEKLEQINAAHKEYDGNASEASRHIPYASVTILKHWSDAGLKPKERGLAPEKLEQINAAHKEYDGNALEASRHLHYSPTTIIKYWRNAGLN